MRIFHALALTTALFGLPAASFAAAFQNGDFEAPGIADGTQTPAYPGAEPAGWTAGGTATSSEYNLFLENGAFGVIGIAGPNAVGFGGDGTSGATLSQTFDTTAGSSYSVGFFVTSQQGADAVQSMRLDAFGASSSLLASSPFDISNIDPAVEAFDWHAGSLSFVADSASTTLVFTDTSDPALSGSANWALDGVTVSGSTPAPPLPPITAAVPEPSTWALMFIGLGLLGGVARRPGRG